MTETTDRRLSPLVGTYGWDYDNLIASMPVEVLVKVEDNDYQGDTRLLLRDGARFGVLTFGWGSCSGCDALEAAYDNVEAATSLRDQLWSEVHWESDAPSMATYLREKDWSLTYMDGDGTTAFVSESVAALAAR